MAPQVLRTGGKGMAWTWVSAADSVMPLACGLAGEPWLQVLPSGATAPTHWRRDVAVAVSQPSGEVIGVCGAPNRPEAEVYANHFGLVFALLPDGDALIAGGMLGVGNVGFLIERPASRNNTGFWHVTDIAEPFHAPG